MNVNDLKKYKTGTHWAFRALLLVAIGLAYTLGIMVLAGSGDLMKQTLLVHFSAAIFIISFMVLGVSIGINRSINQLRENDAQLTGQDIDTAPQRKNLYEGDKVVEVSVPWAQKEEEPQPEPDPVVPKQEDTRRVINTTYGNVIDDTGDTIYNIVDK